MSTLYADPHTLVARILRRTVRNDNGCWIWTGARTSVHYGIISGGKRQHPVLTHRVMVIARDGGIPDGMTVDHLCHDAYTCTAKPCPHRRCVNPDHLAVVSNRANNARNWDRGTCREGHPLTKRPGSKYRYCKTCGNEYSRKYWYEVRKPAAKTA